MFKKLFVTLLFIASFFIVAKTQNLVPNHSFEEYERIPYHYNQIEFSINWQNPTNATPDYFHVQAPHEVGKLNLGVPRNEHGFMFAAEGEAYAGLGYQEYSDKTKKLNYYEYIQIPLKKPLEAGKKYLLSFYVCLAKDARFAINSIGAYLSATANKFSQTSCLIQQPQVFHVGKYLDNKKSWTLIQDSLVAAGGEKFLTIGCFEKGKNLKIKDLQNAETKFAAYSWYAYYFVDNIHLESMEKVKPNQYPQNILSTPPKDYDFSSLNLVPNPSFEKYLKVPKDTSEIQNCSNWINANSGTADYFHKKSKQISKNYHADIYGNPFGYQTAKSGNAYAGIAYTFVNGKIKNGEYLQTKLNLPLQAGKKYCVSFNISLAENAKFALNSIGALLTNSPISQKNNAIITKIPKIYHKGEALQLKSGWQELKFEYKANGGEQYLCLGNFFDALDDKLETTEVSSAYPKKQLKIAYYFIDEVKVIEMKADESCGEKKKVIAKIPENFVANYGFEEYYDLPKNKFEFKQVKNWKSGNKNYSDYIHKNAGFQASQFKQKDSGEGNAFATISANHKDGKILASQYIVAELKEKLSKDEQYCLKFKVLGNYDEKNAVEIYLSRYFNDKSFKANKDNLREIHSKSNGKSGEWTNFEAKYTAIGGEKYIYITLPALSEIPLEMAQGFPKISVGIDDIHLSLKCDTCDCFKKKTETILTQKKLEIKSINKDSVELDSLYSFENIKVGSLLKVSNIHFVSGKYELDDESKSTLDSLVNFLNFHKHIKLEIHGHTDYSGNKNDHQKLSEYRTDAVVNYLEKKGVNRSRITEEAFGSSNPIYVGKDMDKRAKNRRVEFIIIEK